MGSAGSSGSRFPMRLPERLARAVGSSEDSSEGGLTSKFTHVVLGRIRFLTSCPTEDGQFLAGCWPDASLSSLPHGPPAGQLKAWRPASHRTS